MTESDIKQLGNTKTVVVLNARVAGIIAACSLVLSLAGGWTASRVQSEVTASRVDDIRARMVRNEEKIDANTQAVARMAVTIERMSKWLDRQGVE